MALQPTADDVADLSRMADASWSLAEVFRDFPRWPDQAGMREADYPTGGRP